MRRSVLRGVVRGVAFLTLSIVMIGLLTAAAPLGDAVRRPLRRAWARGVCAILGFRINRVGEPFRACPTLYVSNHSSYLDVPVLASFLDATFIAKSEVAGWPFFGLVARVGGTMFVRRHWRLALIQRNTLAARMRAGESFVLFGEGTSTNGMDVKPFKTSLLSVAEPWVLDRPIAVQPVTLVYLRLRDGTPLHEANASLYAWWASADLMPHLWRILRLEGCTIELRIGAPVVSWGVADRKALGRQLRDEVRGRLLELRAAAQRTTAVDEAVAALP
jgi:1-acyl-sn-glycerol-3-phosphate acyltransferase